jgi:hypothetical protein
VDGSAVSCTEVVVDPFPAGVDAKVATRVDQELQFSKYP